MTVQEMYEQYGDQVKLRLEFGVERDMDYPEFCQVVAGQIKNYLPKEYQNYEVQLEEIQKNGGNRVCLLIREPGPGTCPVLYLEQYYQEYKEGQSLDSIGGQIAKLRFGYEVPRYLGDTRASDLGLIMNDWDEVKDRVVFTVVGISDNADYLANRPYTPMGGDLAAVYKVYLGPNRDGSTYGISITEPLLSSWNMTLSDLHEVAMKNTQERFPAEIVSLDGMLDQLGAMEDLPSVHPESYVSPTIVTNKQMIDGAAALFYPEVLETLNRMYPEGMVIAPSSVHEVLVLPVTQITAEKMDEIVQAVNETEVSQEERLSDYAHVYDPQTHLLYAPGLAAKREQQQERGVQQENSISDGPSRNQNTARDTKDTPEISQQRHDGLMENGSGSIGAAESQTMDEESFEEPERRYVAR
ncbi:MAG: DUF5688 family protein [Clostridiales bacterium]|nr:DUF5688 family protein [Clostridiales bacterium]